MRPCFFLRFVALTVVLFLLGHRCVQAETIDENRVIAAMSFQLLRFAEWTAAKPQQDPMIVGVHGSERLAGVFKEIASEPKYSGSLVVERIGDGASLLSLEKYSAIYFSGSDLHQTSRLIGKVGKRPIVLIGNYDEFLEMGGMVRFYLREGRLTFDVNLTNSRRNNIEYRAKLLRLANRVVDDE